MWVQKATRGSGSTITHPNGNQSNAALKFKASDIAVKFCMYLLLVSIYGWGAKLMRIDEIKRRLNESGI